MIYPFLKLSVLSKGLSFVPVKKSTDEYQVKADCEKFYRRLRLRAHFHNEEASGSQATPDPCDPFAKLNDKESTRGPFLERPGKLTGPVSYFEIEVWRKVGVFRPLMKSTLFL